MAVYLDHAAGTPMRASAAAALAEAAARVGNPSSVHRHGQAARAALEEARERLAAVLGSDPLEVVLTSGGTESVNLAITGAYRAARGRDAVLVPGGEHAATVEAVDALVADGARLVPLAVDENARLHPSVLEAALAEHRDTAALVTLLHANNEVGTVNPVPELAALTRATEVPLHVDAVASFGAIPVSFRDLGADLLSVSAHKVGGPAGIGALVVARSAAVAPLLHGGGQERGLRSGTPATALAVAFAAAAEEAVAELGAEAERVAALRDRALAGVLARVPGAIVRGADPSRPGERLPNNLHVTVPGADGEDLLVLLDTAGVSVSTGSACLAGVARISPVLLAMGVPVEEARGALRITFGHTSTEEDVDALLAALPRLAPAIRG